MEVCEFATLVASALFVLLTVSPSCIGAAVGECCWNGGVFDISINACVCPETYWGRYCQLVGSCISKCKNGGICDMTVPGQYRCNCSNGYQGDTCEESYYANYPSQETATITMKCGIIVTSSAPSTGKTSNYGILMLYLIIFILIVAFTILTIHFKREFKSIRKQERDAIRRQLDRRIDSFQPFTGGANMYDEDVPTVSGIHVITPLHAPFKLGQTHTFPENPPPYHTVVDCVILEEDEDEAEAEEEAEEERRNEQEQSRD